MTRRRVVVTGLGCVSPVGNTVAESWGNLLAGKPGIDFITQFDAANFACRFAGEVKGFDIAAYIPEKEARHMDRFIHLGLAAACQEVAARAQEHFERADQIMAACPRRAVRAPRLMEAAYRRILAGLTARGWSPPRRPVKISKLSLLGAVVRHGIGG